MAEEITKVIENVDKLFPEIIVNGESHVSERYVEPPQADIPASTPQTQEEEPTYPQQTVQGEYVDKLNLNGIEHDLKDSPLSQIVEDIRDLIPSQASSSNKLADKDFVSNTIADAINDLDVATEGGSGKYIKSIKQENGKIVAEADWLSSTGGGVAFIGTRAQYETAKLIPLGQTGHIPSGALVIITDEDDYLNSEDK